MLFYIISLIVAVFATAALAYAFSRSLDRNNARRNKRPISYLAPVFLSLFLVIFTLDYTAPRLFDLVTIISGNYEVNEIKLSRDEIRWGTIMVGGKAMYYNRFQYKPQPDVRYRMTALPYSHHVISLDTMTDDTSTGGLP